MIIGDQDQLFCINPTCDDIGNLTAVEKQFFPDSKNFSVVVSEGSGHDLNFDFNAKRVWQEILACVIDFN